MLTRIKRILMSLFLPPLMGTLLVWLVVLFIPMILDKSRNLNAPGNLEGLFLLFYVILVLAFIYSGIQTIIYTGVMEFLGIKWIQKSSSPRKTKYLLLGIILGGLTGLSCGLWAFTFGIGVIEIVKRFIIALIIGLIVGLTVTMLKLKSHLTQRVQRGTY